MYRKTLIACLALVCASFSLFAQTKTNVEFGKVSPKDFSLDGISVDTSYGAVVIADVGKSSFAGNSKGYFSLVYKHQRRVKILSSKAFDIATVNIPLYKSTSTENEEELSNLKASTYNLENGKVVETKLEKDALFKEKQDKNHTLRKFTMPAVKEGSIIEYSYTITSDFLFNLQPWSFQGSYPRLWSEYELNCPEFFEYVVLSKGYHPLHSKDSKTKFQNFLIRLQDENIYSSSQVIDLSSNNTITRWIMKDVPAIKEESFTSAISNHMSSIEFQMSGQRFPKQPFKDILGSWSKLSLDLMKDEDFGAEFTAKSGWADDYLQALKLDGKTPLEKAKAIYQWIQKDFSSKGTSSGIYLSMPLKDVVRAKKGFVPDINLLLTLMLKKAGLAASPVILSTRSHGFVTETYPLVHQYNYVATKLGVDTSIYYLDASDRSLGFGKLPAKCYNGVGICIGLVPVSEPLYAGDNLEAKATSITLVNDAKNKNRWVGSLSSYLGYAESTNLRDEVTEKGKDPFISKIKESYTSEFAVDEVKMDDFDNNEKPVKLNYILAISRNEDDNLIYFNPMLKEGIKENYFKTTERLYPVELPFKMQETYMFNIQVPEGYAVDEIPKSAKVSLNGGDGFFEYMISAGGDFVNLSTKVTLNKAVFTVEEYQGLKDFFDYVVKKHAEQIVFKKKKS